MSKARKGSGGYVTLGVLAVGGAIAAGVAIFLNRIKTAAYEAAPGVFHRDPQSILDAVATVDPEHNPDLQRGAAPAAVDGTWCNKAAYLILQQLGIDIPWGDYGTKADDIIAWIDAGNDGWYQVSQDDAQALALNGGVVLATYYNMGGPGHIAIVLPIGGPTIQIAQAGAQNFDQGDLVHGFGFIKPTFYAHV